MTWDGFEPAECLVPVTASTKLVFKGALKCISAPFVATFSWVKAELAGYCPKAPLRETTAGFARVIGRKAVAGCFLKTQANA